MNNGNDKIVKRKRGRPRKRDILAKKINNYVKPITKKKKEEEIILHLPIKLY